jgi:tetratricopeptide (TPR) repeat protein
MRDQESTGLALYHSRLVLWLSEGLMRAGQLDEALDQAQRAMALTRERGEHGLQAWALYLLGELAFRREPPDVETADVHYRGALTIAEADDLQPLVARCHDGLGKLYRTAGRRSEAREHLLLAASLYGRMQMQFWLDQTKPQFDALA